MNNRRRNALRVVVEKLEECYNVVDSISEDEQDSLENTPENLKESDRYYRMEEAADNLEEAAYQIEDAIEHIEMACGG